MLAYQVNSRMQPMPHTSNRFWVSRVDRFGDYDFIDKLTNKSLPVIKDNDDLFVEFPLDTFYGKTVDIEYLVALAFKPIYLPRHKLKHVWVENKKEENIAENLVWKYDSSGISCDDYPGFNYIPCFSRYVINEYGDVISLISGEKMEYHVGTNGYKNMRLTRDDGVSGLTTTHRLVMLAFTDYPLNADELHVNHMDFDKLNTQKSNMEWTSANGNSQHARLFLSEKRKKSVKIILDEIESGTEYIFESIQEAARHFKVGPSHIWQAINHGAEPRVFKGKYLVRYEGMPKFNNPKSLLNKPTNGRPRKVIVKNISTGEEKIYDTAISFVKDAVGLLSKKQIYSRLKKGDERPINGFTFKYLDNA